MTEDQIEKALQHIQEAAEAAGDPEKAHSRELDLFIAVLMWIRDGEIADPAKAAELALQSCEMSFERWYV